MTDQQLQKSSTQRIREVIDQLRAIEPPKPEEPDDPEPLEPPRTGGIWLQRRPKKPPRRVSPSAYCE